MDDQKKRNALECMMDSVEVVALQKMVEGDRGNIFEIYEVYIRESKTILAVVIDTAKAEIKEGDYSGVLETAVGHKLYRYGEGGFREISGSWWEKIVFRKVLGFRAGAQLQPGHEWYEFDKQGIAIPKNQDDE